MPGCFPTIFAMSLPTGDPTIGVSGRLKYSSSVITGSSDTSAMAWPTPDALRHTEKRGFRGYVKRWKCRVRVLHDAGVGQGLGLASTGPISLRPRAIEIKTKARCWRLTSLRSIFPRLIPTYCTDLIQA